MEWKKKKKKKFTRGIEGEDPMAAMITICYQLSRICSRKFSKN